MDLAEYYFKHVKIRSSNGESISPPYREIDDLFLRCVQKAKEMNVPLMIRHFGRHSTGGMKINPVVTEAVEFKTVEK